MTKRSIGMMILLGIVTLGIYYLYWVVSFQSELKRETGEGFGGFAHLIMIFVTFGIYLLYWEYKVGERLEKLGRPNNGALYLVLNFVALGWITFFLMQNEANQIKDDTKAIEQSKQIEV